MDQYVVSFKQLSFNDLRNYVNLQQFYFILFGQNKQKNIKKKA